MPENQETEAAKLESFRMEIKGVIRRAVENKDGTAMLVTDIGELDAQDMALWEDFKRALLELDSLDVTDSEEDLKIELKRILDLSEKLEMDTAASIEKAKQQSKESKIQFGAWLRNKNPFSAVSIAFDRAQDEGLAVGVKDAQDILKDITDLYAKGGWQNKETKD